MQSGTEGGRNCWGRDISYIAIVQEDINKGTMEGAGQVRENIQHLVSDTTVWQEGKQALPPRAGGWQNGCVINHNRSRSRRPGVKEENTKDRRGEDHDECHYSHVGLETHKCEVQETPEQRCLVTRRTKTGWRTQKTGQD